MAPSACSSEREPSLSPTPVLHGVYESTAPGPFRRFEFSDASEEFRYRAWRSEPCDATRSSPNACEESGTFALGDGYRTLALIEDRTNRVSKLPFKALASSSSSSLTRSIHPQSTPPQLSRPTELVSEEERPPLVEPLAILLASFLLDALDEGSGSQPFHRTGLPRQSSPPSSAGSGSGSGGGVAQVQAGEDCIPGQVMDRLPGNVELQVRATFDPSTMFIALPSVPPPGTRLSVRAALPEPWDPPSPIPPNLSVRWEHWCYDETANGVRLLANPLQGFPAPDGSPSRFHPGGSLLLIWYVDESLSS